MATNAYPFTRILIPYDGSLSAEKALEWGAYLARAGGEAVEKVTLLRVIGGGYLSRHIQNVDLRTTRMDEVDTWRRVRQHYLDQEITPMLEEAKNRLQEEGLTAVVETRIIEGKIGKEIMRYASEGGYDAIIMGRRGLSPVKAVFLGSVTREVLGLGQHMTIFVAGPETVIHPDCPISPLLLPVDGSEPSQMAVRQGAALALKFKDRQPQLTLLHVVDYAALNAAYAEGMEPLVREGEKNLAAGRRLIEDAGLRDLVAEKLLAGAPAKAIAEEAEAGQYALILMGARGLSPLKQLFLGSVSHDVLHLVSQALVGIIYP